MTSDRPGEGPWTYREVGERAERVAAGLAGAGVRRGDRAAVEPEAVTRSAALRSTPAVEGFQAFRPRAERRRSTHLDSGRKEAR